MGFIDSVKNGFANYATFSGRARRSEYWFWQLFLFMTSLATGILSSADGTFPDGSARMGVFTAIAGLASLGLLLPSLAVLVRRLHDTSRSAWHVVYWGVIPALVSVAVLIVGSIAFVQSYSEPDSLSGLLAWLGLAFAALIPVSLGNLVLFVFTLLDSHGPNRFGMSPKQEQALAALDGTTA